MDNFFIITGIFSILIGSYLKYEHNHKNASKITPKIAKHLIECGAKVLDVRLPSEPGSVTRKNEKGEKVTISINIPGKKISKETLKDKGLIETDIIITFCNSGTRARQAADKLNKLGYKNVYYIVETFLSLQE